ncbi:DUF55-domain-containing protein [Annulohypoxylon truncatum]|uniref:DUF55-domain-containing protein n=1 Tax=Annulohypoxylon truncatum TaxID=327061 RepID=UPI002007BE7C|nr:DUF55-domain-containing protein [Annulohypoxylon truncatum]KAI1207895.1 DUF55-domain-containing protein [Annulohypoxylon truncatum]
MSLLFRSLNSKCFVAASTPLLVGSNQLRMVKRKASQVEAAPDVTNLRRSTRRKPLASESTIETSQAKSVGTSAPQPSKSRKESVSEKLDSKKSSEPPKPKTTAKAKAKNATHLSSGSEPEADKTSNSSEISYWLMKAEPETRIERGVDVKFSIDDLKSRTEPEPWDGIRNYVARNNLREMKKGDIAFFYHSNCKEPGIVGTMEIVQEHSPDLSAHDPKAAYYDASSKPDNPKWSVVHVVFRSKFNRKIELKDLRDMGKPGQPLENMQMLKQSRLSVSRVSPAEFEFLMGVVEVRGGETLGSC